MTKSKSALSLLRRLRKPHRLHVSPECGFVPRKDYLRKGETEENRYQFRKGYHRLGKPVGVWYGFNESWVEWCSSNTHEGIFPYIYEIKFDENAKVLRITNLEEFDAFAEAYSYPDPLFELGPTEFDFSFLLRKFGMTIDFERVESQYDAMEIVPYLHQRRLESRWYYGWDCASGVFWNYDLVKVELFAYYNERTECYERTDLK